ncbi:MULTISPECIES: class I SAM-dependent methyltransferase [Paenibacillus]|uniref:Methyltransferase type 11 n=2 Tax=Paenibacillus lactis TaxID=228574 RepID=G4HMC2_9BACL|nr:class I SAM-dependent methyltransferase [Paenibacillus lactis]EHB54674.1 Methyltransferase type 11 [Paenibacillus lactis 154]MBP1891010.1 2-polyprenyl-3-methyl-5-hydroxy-6-metoxy-1,4-benzoquinol methylase [Paenibacillus lactis]HAF99083.1 class I SAM-dependent methyltransferase [Paenibacillus lactis]
MMNHFDEKYYSGNSNYTSYQYDTRFIQWSYDIKKYLNPKTLLDVGCAKGYLVRSLRLLGVDAKGVDISSYAIENADEYAIGHVVCSSATKIPFEGKFDLVIAFDILEHIPEPEVFEAIDELSRLGNTVFLKMPHFYDPWDLDETHVTLYPKSWWYEQFANRGFDVIEDHEILSRFNYMGGMLFSKVQLNRTFSEPVVSELASQEERNYFEKCKHIDIF